MLVTSSRPSKWWTLASLASTATAAVAAHQLVGKESIVMQTLTETTRTMLPNPFSDEYVEVAGNLITEYTQEVWKSSSIIGAACVGVLGLTAAYTFYRALIRPAMDTAALEATLAANQAPDTRLEVIAACTDDDYPERMVVAEDIRQRVDYLAHGRIRSQEGLKDVYRALDRQWKEEGLSVGMMLLYKRMATAAYWVVPKEELEVNNLASNYLVRLNLFRQTEYLESGSQPDKWSVKSFLGALGYRPRCI
jgi:hypothetical protein